MKIKHLLDIFHQAPNKEVGEEFKISIDQVKKTYQIK